MIIQYLEFVFAPFRAIWNKFQNVKAIKGNVAVELGVVKSLGKRGKNMVATANDKIAKLGGAAGQAGQPAGQAANETAPAQPGYGQPQAAYGQPSSAQPGAQPAMYAQPQAVGYGQPQPAYGQPHTGQPAPAAPGQPFQYPGQFQAQGAPPMQQAPGSSAPGPAAAGMPSSNPRIISKGFWIFKKKHCSQCEQLLDNSWDSCPYCVQIAAQAVAAPAKQQALKTQAFVLDSSGGPGQLQLLGWLVPLQGAQRGELFTLSPNSTIGTDPSCTVCLNDKFMSGRHAEIRAEAGLWILRDGGSTNGTFVNNRRVDRHELVDNDFIKFGSAMVKFKSL